MDDDVTTITRRMATNRSNFRNEHNKVINMGYFIGSQEHGDNAEGALEGVEDEVEFTYKDLDQLKDANKTMEEKRQMRRKILQQLDQVKRSRWSPRGNVKWKRFKEDLKEIFRQAALWRSSIREIEGRFGSGVRSYFFFLRWLFLLNVGIFLLNIIFIVTPTVVFENLRNSNVSIDSQSNIAHNVSANCTYNPYDPNALTSFSEYMVWCFTGQGFIENTVLFIGYYDNAATFLQSTSVYFYYNIPLAYILVAFSYFFLSFALILRSAAVGFKQSLVSDEDRFYTYCNKVFAGWDYCITDERAAELKQSSLKMELETTLKEEIRNDRRTTRTRNEKIILYVKRFFINLLVVAILAACLAAIFKVAQFALQNRNTYNNDFFLDLVVTYLTSIVITAINFVAPFLFGILIRLEDYSPGFELQFTLIRTVILRLTSVIFLYVVVYLQIYCTWYPSLFGEVDEDSECEACDGMECWETYLGQEMYKLTLFNFFIVISVTLFVEFPRKLIVNHCHCGLAKWWGEQEFSISENVLDILYAQTVAWIGAFYAPLLPFIVCIKFFIFFYLKKLTLLYNCRLATQPYRASKSGTFFFIILLVGFAVAALPVAVSMGSIKPSTDCGPFRGWATMFDSVTLAIKTIPQWLQDIFWFIGSAGCAVIVGVILCFILYYYVALSTAHKKMIAIFKDQLSLEGKDKQFLLNQMKEELTRRERIGGMQVVRKRTKSRIGLTASLLTPERRGGWVNRGFVDSPHDNLSGQASF